MNKIVKGGMILAMAFTGNAYAELLKVDLTGQVDYLYNYYSSSNSTISQGDTVNYSFIIDTSAPATDSNSGNNSYSYPEWNYSYSNTYSYSNLHNSIQSFSGTIGSQTFSGTSGSAYVQDNAGSYTYGSYNSTWDNNYQQITHNRNGGYWDSTNNTYVSRNDFTSSSDNIQYFNIYRSATGSQGTTAADLVSALLSSSSLNFYFQQYDPNNYWNGQTYGSGTFTAASVSAVSSAVSAVPVPAAVWLLGSGMVGLVGMARKRATPALHSA